MLNSKRGSALLLAVTWLLVNSVPESSSQKARTVTCEGRVARLKCDKGQVIFVNSAIYGRRNKNTCSARRPASQIQNVRCSRSSNKVAESCNGEKGCSISATNSVFGDPCQGTYKYLEVDYTCKLPESSSQKARTVTCEGRVARLKCDKGQVIFVNSAIYGRRNKNTCSARRPASQIQNVRCSRSSNKVAERCNGKRVCVIRATNSFFGEPCAGTYKYLEVEYTCYAAITG
ncbi:L-rhamnose-binding lectin CSL2-like [Kryptolebias marmoratus]|uniref:L-rhamnose-binding lectin CSL2-like n=1 Tax=Kryptolebias marmoratus TaxID=37003 RepID=UPI0007F927FF|nr:L-rhamnose-binding lectin CSL2-like [Kryptolebias marmoratus]